MELKELNKKEWEDLCDNCGRCCLHKLEDENGKIHFTNVVCKHLINESCQCSDYSNRSQLVKNCLSIDKSWLVDNYKFKWLPKTCAYRTIFEKRELESWHPLVSKNKNSVHFAGVSIRGRCYNDKEIKERDFYKHIINWVE